MGHLAIGTPYLYMQTKVIPCGPDKSWVLFSGVDLSLNCPNYWEREVWTIGDN